METKEILAERQSTHGDFTDNSSVAQRIKDVIDSSPAKLSYVQKEALDFIASKIGRICSGNANEPDHWRDIAGYATLAADRIPVVPDHPELPLGSFQMPTIPTGWRVKMQDERINTLSRVWSCSRWTEFSPMLLGKTMKTYYEEFPGATVITPDWHQGDKDVAYPGIGYRFLLKNEKRPSDLEYYLGGQWETCADRHPEQILNQQLTYRTKCPLPTIA